MTEKGIDATLEDAMNYRDTIFRNFLRACAGLWVVEPVSKLVSAGKGARR
jgi:hypothetical protein